MKTSERIITYSVLELAANNNGVLPSRQWLQRCAYLLKNTQTSGFTYLRFEFGTNGPYSRELSEALRNLITATLIEEKRTSSADGVSDRSYILTALGKSWLEENIPDRDKCLQRSIKAFNRTSYEVLELSSMALYFLHGYARSRDEALRRSVEIKPELEGQYDKAKGFLSRMSRLRQPMPKALA